MPTKQAYLGGGLYIRPRDFTKLGQLYLAGGKWNGKQIIDENWTKESFKISSEFKPYFPEDAGHKYGYGWHIRDHEVNGKVYRIYWMGGNGGQMVIAIPDLDMVVEFTGGDYNQTRKFINWEIQYLPKYLIPAALPKK